MSVEQFIEWGKQNEDKIFEASFGDYWVQLPFGLVVDFVDKLYAYAQEETVMKTIDNLESLLKGETE